MASIRILPEIIANKIAAGEVVERPASVVKELVENAIDAGGSRIIVEIEQGGRKLIRVSDDGAGMGRDDALLSLERYATSKIATDSDLFAIRTLGFRGEALPSIASVCKLTLISRETRADVGTRIEVAGGRINKVMDTGAPTGTMISVASLFYNTPARRKFLKSINTEMGHIADTIASMALCRPAVQFRLSHNNRIVKNWAAAADPTDRVADVLGTAIKKELHPVDRMVDDTHISGWVAAAGLKRSTARGIFMFVNGRWIKDRVIQHALFAGYRGRLMKGQYPVAVLFVEVPFDQVDVNVHPAKHEIRFVHQKIIHDGVRDAVAEALKRSDPTRWPVPQAGPEPRMEAAIERSSGVSEQPGDFAKPPVHGMDRQAGQVVDALSDQPTENRHEDRMDRTAPPTTHPAAAHHPQAPFRPAGHPQPAGQPPRQAPLWQQRFFSDLTLIGQYKGTYIICASDDGLMLIDQHAAHERIVFEQLKHQSGERRPSVQRLLLPETIDLGFREAQILERLAPELDSYGLEIEPFGGNTFVVKAVPTLLDSGNISALITQLVEKTAQIGVEAELEAIMDGCLMVMACHHAIRANQQLDACDNPSHCPHGRPIWIQWTVKDLGKQFRRIV